MATTGIRTSSSIVAVAEKTRLLPLSSIVTVVKEALLLPAFSGLRCYSGVLFFDPQCSSTVAVVEENWLLPAFGSS